MAERVRATTRMTRLGHVYLATVIAFGVAAVGSSLYEVFQNPLANQWYLLAALTLVSGSATVTLPTVGASISVSETFVFASVLLFGPSAGTITVALDGLVISFWLAKRLPEWYRALFNMAAPSIAAWVASHLFFAAAGIQPLFNATTPIDRLFDRLFIPLVIFAVVYFGVNSWLITFAVAFEKHLSPYRVWRQNFLWLSLNYFSAASVALLLVIYSRQVDIRFIGMIVPLLLVLYLTFKTTMGRVEDANRHVEQLNGLYLSTIETLAMAIDAKDQVTHGHIRRVQAFATQLAREVGVRDETLLKAIEAAALLHDMGKLAVPEYILNKPGKLTEAEFEKMKLHASVGADILSAVEFPYPVVPIVRHHHENWDGTGYPAGLHGTDIPIGARILSVVDCFDALTSDRPYRPRLSNEEALRILRDRRGTMYDPLIVDTFARVHQLIVPAITHVGPPTDALNEIASARKNVLPSMNSPVLDEIAASADEMLTVYELARGLAGQVSFNDAADIIVKHIRRLIPCSLCVFFTYRSGTAELEAEHCVGEGASLVRGTRIQVGQRLSGWVAATRQTICNSDPTLDFGEVVRSRVVKLRSCLSTPLVCDGSLVGVLSLYSDDTDAFCEDHRRVIELVGGHVARTFKSAIEFDEMPRRDPLTGLPSVTALDEIVKPGDQLAAYSVLFIDVAQLKQINTSYGRTAGDDVLRHVVDATRRGLRVADILFRHTSDEFVAFLSGADAETADAVARRVRQNITAHPVRLADGSTLNVTIAVIAASSPRDGSSVRDLVSRARIRAASEPGDWGSTVH